MTDDLPAIVQPAREIARTDTDSWTDVFSSVVELARGIAETEFVPRGLRGSIPATTAAILYGREVGLPPMTALNSTHVIEGKPSIEAQAMRAMILAAGHEIEVLESTGQLCRMRARRRGSERWTPEVLWTLDMARAAGLSTKTNWQRHPRRMLQARCSSELAELYFPDVVMGFRSLEEMQDATDEQAPDEKPTTAVQRAARKRAVAKTTTAQAPTAPREPVAGPPLPGEPGYDPVETSTGGDARKGKAAAASVDTETTPEQESTALTDAEGRPTTADTSTAEAVPAPAPESSDDDVHDAEIVEDEPPKAPAEPGPRTANRAQIRALFKVLERFDVDEDNRHHVVSGLVGRPIGSFNDLLASEISPALDTLALLKGRADLDALLEAAAERQTN